jgi:hypothetical protein
MRFLFEGGRLKTKKVKVGCTYDKNFFFFIKRNFFDLKEMRKGRKGMRGGLSEEEKEEKEK